MTKNIIQRAAIYYVYVNSLDPVAILSKTAEAQKKLNTFFNDLIIDDAYTYKILVMPTFTPDKEGLQIV